ncbi:hypothetical protein JCGZ_26533 [Jatropha curcas]|uniref:Aminotransferase-like plant mobile domain-containing protein n=1 Tax=Jatropha curcas TaxID=180498 RepID=A0A067LGU6_JATCU|nr:hypothetical protein JCGZ_26533 [Jatropha curcas]
MGSQAHVFRFGTHNEDMCLTTEEFTALLVSDCERTPVAAPTGAGFFRGFTRMLGLSVIKARELVADDRVNLTGLIVSILELACLCVLAKVLSEKGLNSKLHLDVCLDLGSREGVWLRDLLRVLEPPRCRPYVPSQYRSRRVVVRLESEDEWFQMAYLFGMDSITYYPSSKLMRQMGHVQGLPPAGALFRKILISPRITMAILGSWLMGAQVVEVGDSRVRTATYEAWWMAEHGDRKRERRVTLT